MKRYLNGDPIPWLADGENQAVTYLTKCEFFENVDPGELYPLLYNSKLTDFFLKNSSGGILGNRRNFDLFYRGTVWFFLMAVESGYDSRTDFIRNTADFICEESQLDDGGFSLNWTPQVSVGCRTGNMVYALLRAGIKDERASAGISWIIKKRRHDGGWLHCPFRGVCDTMRLVFFRRSGKGHLDDGDSSLPSCPVATYTCMNALAEAGEPSFAAALSRAAEFFLSRDLIAGAENKTGCGLFSDPSGPGYPVMSQYDIISLMRLVAGTPLLNSSRGGELFNFVIRSQNGSGRWSLSNPGQGMIRETEMESRWVTLNALRMIKAVTRGEAQLEKA